MIKNYLDIFYLAIIETCIAGRKVGSQSCKSDTGWVRRSIWNLSITGSIWWILFGFYALKNVEISSFKTISIQTAEGRNFPRLIMMEKVYICTCAQWGGGGNWVLEGGERGGRGEDCCTRSDSAWTTLSFDILNCTNTKLRQRKKKSGLLLDPWMPGSVVPQS